MDSRFVLIIIFLLFLSFGPDQQSFRRHSASDLEEIDRWSQRLLGVLRNSSYGDLSVENDRWLNLTGFRKNDDYQWNLLPGVQDLILKRFGEAAEGFDQRNLPVYQNPTGEIHGPFRTVLKGHRERFINLTSVVGNSEYLTNEYQRNITDSRGDITIDLVSRPPDKEDELVREAKARLKIYSDSSPSNGWDGDLIGVHLVNSGHIVLTTISDKFNAGFALPHFMLDENEFNVTKPLVDSLMTEAVRKVRHGESPTRSNSVFLAPSCEMIIWLCQRPIPPPVSGNQSMILKQIEQELESPEGAPIGEVSTMEFQAILFSPDCGFVLDSQLMGPKAEEFWLLARRFLVAMMIVIGLKIMLLKRQMEEAFTPSTRCRISYQTILMMATGDGMLFSTLIYILIVDDNVWLMVAATAFLNSLNVAFLEVKFLYDLWIVQVGQPAERERDRVQAMPIEPRAGLPLPVTTRRPVDTGATAIILPPDQEIEMAVEGQTTGAITSTPPMPSFAALYSRFYFATVILMFFSMWAYTWPDLLRTAYANTCSFLYLSFWIPQIYRNVIRNCRRALSWEYVIGISILRTFTTVYWYLDDQNILSIHVNPNTAYTLISWVWLQVLVLASQQFLGPRLLVREKWCPPAYDYHPILRQDEEETGLPIGFVASASEGKDKDDKNQNRKIFDCAICMNEIDVPVVTKGEGKGSTWLEQRYYMVTPCRHIFHTECLEGWMNLRLVCPICRESLPPL